MDPILEMRRLSQGRPGQEVAEFCISAPGSPTRLLFSYRHPKQPLIDIKSPGGPVCRRNSPSQPTSSPDTCLSWDPSLPLISARPLGNCGSNQRWDDNVFPCAWSLSVDTGPLCLQNLVTRVGQEVSPSPLHCSENRRAQEARAEPHPWSLGSAGVGLSCAVSSLPLTPQDSPKAAVGQGQQGLL